MRWINCVLMKHGEGTIEVNMHTDLADHPVERKGSKVIFFFAAKEKGKTKGIKTTGKVTKVTKSTRSGEMKTFVSIWRDDDE